MFVLLPGKYPVRPTGQSVTLRFNSPTFHRIICVQMSPYKMTLMFCIVSTPCCSQPGLLQVVFPAPPKVSVEAPWSPRVHYQHQEHGSPPSNPELSERSIIKTKTNKQRQTHTHDRQAVYTISATRDRFLLHRQTALNARACEPKREPAT